MALDVSGLTAYVDENKLPLIRQSILNGRTLDMIQVQGGIKTSAMINIIDSPLTAVAGACGFSASGDTTLTQRELVVSDLKVNESICLTTLEGFYTQTKMNPGSYNESIPFEQIYAEEKVSRLNALIEDLVWRGDIGGGAGNLALSDGLVLLLSTTEIANVVNGNTGAITVAVGITAANIIAIVDAMVAAIPENAIDASDLKLFMSYAHYRLYTQALRNANLFHFAGNEGTDFRIMIPGTNVEAVATKGLTGVAHMYVSPASNIYFGTDLLSDAENFSLFYSKDNDEVRFIAKWKQGVQVAFPELVVNFTLVP